jgi:hypothetical protein
MAACKDGMLTGTIGEREDECVLDSRLCMELVRLRWDLLETLPASADLLARAGAVRLASSDW